MRYDSLAKLSREATNPNNQKIIGARGDRALSMHGAASRLITWSALKYRQSVDLAK